MCVGSGVGVESQENLGPCSHGQVLMVPVETKAGSGVDLFNIMFIYLCIYLWLYWVFVAAQVFSLAVESGGYSSLRCVGFLLQWLGLQ